MSKVWAGVDIGKAHHYCVVVDQHGDRLLSRREANGEAELLTLLADVLALNDEVTRAVDVADGGAALLLALLINHDQRLVYISVLAVNRAAASYRGTGKPDARDAAVIANQARLRRDLNPVRPGDEAAVELTILTARRSDLVADRTRTIKRLREQVLNIFPALERALDLTNHGPLVLLTGYQTPAATRRAGVVQL